MYQRILTAVDGSLNAHAAARYAIALAQACEATLFVASVITSKMTGKEEGALAQSAGKPISEAEEKGVSAHLLKVIVFHSLEENGRRGQAVPYEAGAKQLTIVYSPVGHKIFGTAPLPVSAWLFALPFALLLFGADEGRKIIGAKHA